MEQNRRFELSKSSSNEELKRYFLAVLKLQAANEPFPINFDEVWALVYSNRNKAMSSLRDNFIEGIDFNLYQKGKVLKTNEIQNGIRVNAKITVSCMEFFVARKNRFVFEVYRRVFHIKNENKKKLLTDNLSSKVVNVKTLYYIPTQ